MDCLFCKIVRTNEVEKSVIYENDLVMAFMDIQPVNNGHLLIIPKQHYELFYQVSIEETNEMLRVAHELNQALRSELDAEGINYFVADGEVAGQEIFHTHLHLVPRFENDGFGFKFPDDYFDLPSRETLDSLAKQLAGHFD